MNTVLCMNRSKVKENVKFREQAYGQIDGQAYYNRSIDLAA